ncbi:hypothetical protein QFC22_003517 [Naganishia vaughanmartiniae]|uniref:Uncharacterized protein n=1 Tax=Naganishia vaughanmartiniae TaxID=1424756 RepID=A0ACC2X8D5_9TREE|nr:hypothetical protein QFC22_003517 [Naganishia vaughanmartiniae]
MSLHLGAGKPQRTATLLLQAFRRNRQRSLPGGGEASRQTLVSSHAHGLRSGAARPVREISIPSLAIQRRELNHHAARTDQNAGHAWLGNEHGGLRKGDKVVVAMSGGVDSSVTLALLTDPAITSHLSLDISAVFMRNWSPLQNEVDHHSFETDCEWEKDWEDVRRVCKMRDVDAELIDLSNEYWLQVFEPSINAWQSGQTPNPDVSCNREIKFGALMDRVLGPARMELESGMQRKFLATGHYARVGWMEGGRTKLMRSADWTKDQTYYLSSVPEAQLSRALFPLADLKKTQVRELAKKYDLPTASRQESMGVCFIGERGRFGDFVSQYTVPPAEKGNIVTIDGVIVGQHDGLWHYTIGQKAKLGGMDQKYFVARKDPRNNEVVVVPGSDHPALQCASIAASSFTWIWPDHPPVESLDSEEGMSAMCQVRHRMKAVPVTVKRGAGSSTSDLRIEFKARPEIGVSPGQVVGLWSAEGDWCLGSGLIAETTCMM